MIAILAAALAVQTTAPTFIYHDVDAFARAYATVPAGGDPLPAMREYVKSASPGFVAFAKAYGTTAESLAEQVRRRPRYYASLTRLAQRLKSMEPEISKAIEKLSEMAPGQRPVPIYYMVADQKAGGTPKEVVAADGSVSFGILVAIDMLGVTPDLDKEEFPKGPGGRASAEDIPQVVVHEMVHVYQARTQGIDNYRSIFRAETGGSNLAIAIREGAAEFITWLVSGRRLGNRHL